MTIMHKRRLFLIGFIVLAILFSLLSFNYHQPALLNFGQAIQASIYDIWGGFGETIFIIFSFIGSGYLTSPVTACLAIFFYFKHARWTASFLVLNLVGVSLLNLGLKTLFARPRPDLEHLIQVTYYSFPSGHAMNSTAFFGFLAYLLHLRLKQEGKSTASVWLIAGMLIFLIGVSRVYLGVHFPLDVLGGFLAGGSWLLLILFLYTLIPRKDGYNKPF